MMIEILSLVGGGVAGFIFKLIGTMMQNQADLAKSAIEMQSVADASADAAAQRSPNGAWVRRLLVCSVLFAIIGAPFVLSLFGVTTYVEGDPQRWWNPLTWGNDGWSEITGYLILDEVKVVVLASAGYYFGQSSVQRY